MKIERLPFVVGDGQEIAFLTLGTGFVIVLHFIEPLLASVGQVAAQHRRHVERFGHGEHGRRRRLVRDKLAQFAGQVCLDVLPGFLPVLRVLRSATDVGFLAGKE